MEFGNPIVGDEDLIREAIKSPDFSSDPETGVQGWRIARDGSATFYNLVIGSESYTIDENGNAVFANVSADSITLDGESLADMFTAFPRGMLAVTTCPNSTGSYNNVDPLIWGRITIPNFDITRQYRVGFITHIDKQSSYPLYVGLQCRYSFGGTATASSPSLFVSQEATGQSEGSPDEGSSYDDVVSYVHTFSNSSSANNGVNLSLCFTLTSNVSGPRIQGNSYNRIWVEDVGPAVTYGSYDPATDASPTQQYTKTYSANGSASHQSDGTNRNVSECYQGYYSGTNGNQFSVITFPISTIQSDLSGATIDKVELYLNNNHWYSNSGGTAVIGTHPYTSPAGDSNYGDLDPDITRKTFSYGEAKWVTLPNSIGEALRDNSAKGICLGKGPSNSTTYYGYFAGNGQSGEPQLRITYTK